MNIGKLGPWFQKVVASLGGIGLFAVAFLDSSVLSFPVLADVLLIEESIHNPARMPYYAAMATLGSLAGCIWLYLLAKKGGEEFFRRRTHGRAGRIRDWVSANAFLSVALPAILPPPMPFKVFILAAGVFQVPLRTFVLALLLGRGLRYFAEGVLAIRYGEVASHFLVAHKLGFTVSTILTIAVTYVLTRWLFSRAPSHQ